MSCASRTRSVTLAIFPDRTVIGDFPEVIDFDLLAVSQRL